LLWKEVCHGGLDLDAAVAPDALRSWPQLLAIWLTLAGLSLFAHVALPGVVTPLVTGLNYVLRALSLMLAGAWCLALAFRVAGSLSRERDQQTLEALLMLPVERVELLRAKWLGSILRFRHLGYGLAVLWLAGLATGAFHPWAVLLLVAGCG